MASLVTVLAVLAAIAASSLQVQAVPGPGRVTIMYASSWAPAYLHYTTEDNVAWNSVPGRPLHPSTDPAYPADVWQSVTVEGNNVTFVLTNGHGSWDNNHGDNYKVVSAGLYTLKDGIVTPISTFGHATFERTFPSMFLNNWQSLMATWSGPRDDSNQPAAIRSGGLTSVRCQRAGYDVPLLQAEGVAMRLGARGSEPLDDPTGWFGPAFIDASGEFHTPYTKYQFQDLPGGLHVNRTYITPVMSGLDFLLIRYDIAGLPPSNTSSSGPALLSYVTGPAAMKGGNAAASCSQSGGDVTCTMASSSEDSAYQLVFGTMNGDASSFAAAEASGINAVVTQFQRVGTLSGATSASDGSGTGAGFVFSPTTSAGSVWSTYVFIGVAESTSAATTLATAVRAKSGGDWSAASAAKVATWLAKGVQPKLSGSAKDLYTNALLLLKNGQNPTLGTIVASMHPAYLFKVWGRDGAFAAMILDAAGYHEEAGLFLTWMSTAQLRSTGGFHTCYSVWTGEVVGFVEPQYDSTGEFPLAVLHHYLLTGDEAFLATVRGRVRELLGFFIENVEYAGFVPSDYSIWEESSSGLTGKPLPTSYFSFTQSMAYAGLQAGALLEEHTWVNTTAAAELRARASQVVAAVENKLWLEDEGYYARDIWSNTLLVDARHDSQSTAIVYSGLATNATRIQSHLAAINANLTRDVHGLARYTGDPFFYDSVFDPGGQEVGAASPPWGVVDMFMSWAEMQVHGLSVAADRLAWMVDRAAFMAMPVGEAVDGTAKTFVMISCPDLYEDGGVYVWTTLMSQGLAWLPNPATWPVKPASQRAA